MIRKSSVFLISKVNNARSSKVDSDSGNSYEYIEDSRVVKARYYRQKGETISGFPRVGIFLISVTSEERCIPLLKSFYFYVILNNLVTVFCSAHDAT